MLNSLNHLKDRSLQARDGIIGKVHDMFFDETDWIARYLVVDMGTLLNKRSVLISPGAAGSADWGRSSIPVDLTMDQVRHSPEIDTDMPITRQHEAVLRKHYGWPAYWGALTGEGGLATPILIPAGEPDEEQSGPTDGEAPPRRSRDVHLRSANDTLGYHVHATDGSIGHIAEFLIDDDVWRIRYVVIDTRNWLPGRKVLVAPEWIREIDWTAEKAEVALTRDAIKASPAYDASAPWNVEYANRLHEHYARPPYSDWEQALRTGKAAGSETGSGTSDPRGGVHLT